MSKIQSEAQFSENGDTHGPVKAKNGSNKRKANMENTNGESAHAAAAATSVNNGKLVSRPPHEMQKHKRNKLPPLPVAAASTEATTQSKAQSELTTAAAALTNLLGSIRPTNSSTATASQTILNPELLSSVPPLPPLPIPNTFILTTRGEGDCAFHAALGKWNELTQMVECSDIVGKRKNVADLIKTVTKEHPMFPRILDAIVDILSDEHSKQFSELRTEFQKYVKDNEKVFDEAWRQLEGELIKNKAISDFIEANTPVNEKQSSFKIKFQIGLRAQDGVLHGIISSIDTIDKLYQAYTKCTFDSFNLTDKILSNNKAILHQYAEYFAKPGQWLLPGDLQVIAYIFKLNIEYFTYNNNTNSYSNPTAFNFNTAVPQSAPIKISFNGVGHFEQINPNAPVPSAAASSDTSIESASASAASAAATNCLAAPNASVTASVAQTPTAQTATKPGMQKPVTLTFSFTADWNEDNIPYILYAYYGPFGVSTDKAPLCFEFNVISVNPSVHTGLLQYEVPVGHSNRAILWYNGKPHPTYQHALNNSKALQEIEGLKVSSVVFRQDIQQTVNSLFYIKKNPIYQSNGYLKILQGQTYFLNITFAAGSSIFQNIADNNWQYRMQISKPAIQNGINSIISKALTIYDCDWKNDGFELNPNESELKAAQDAKNSDMADEEAIKRLNMWRAMRVAASVPPAPLSASASMYTMPPPPPRPVAISPHTVGRPLLPLSVAAASIPASSVEASHALGAARPFIDPIAALAAEAKAQTLDVSNPILSLRNAEKLAYERLRVHHLKQQIHLHSAHQAEFKAQQSQLNLLQTIQRELCHQRYPLPAPGQLAASSAVASAATSNPAAAPVVAPAATATSIPLAYSNRAHNASAANSIVGSAAIPQANSGNGSYKI